MKEKELSRPHKDYLDHLIRDIIDTKTSPEKREGAEDMYLKRLIRLDRMGYSILEYSNWYRRYMMKNDYRE